MVFLGRFLWIFKTNFVTKSNNIEIFKKLQMNHFFTLNEINRENYLNEIMFLKIFCIWWNKPGRWSQKFAAGVTKLMPPDEIRSFDGTYIWKGFLPWLVESVLYKIIFSCLGLSKLSSRSVTREYFPYRLKLFPSPLFPDAVNLPCGAYHLETLRKSRKAPIFGL